MTHLSGNQGPGGQIPRGVADFFWEEAQARRTAEANLLKLFRTWGYGDVIPPAFEYAGTLTDRGNQALQGELCRFIDRDGSMLALRADMTIAVARLVGTRLHDRPMPQRFCYAGNVFRDVEARAGQQREFWQAGIELIGSHAPDADAEVLALTARALQVSGIPVFQIVLGQMQYFSGMLEALALNEDNHLRLQAAIDRNSEAQLAAFLETAQLPATQRTALERLTRLSGPHVEEILAEARRHALNPTMTGAVDNLAAILDSLAAFGLLDHVTLDLTEIHDLGYYTGITFEALAPGLGFPLASGGRYDHLVGTFGAPQPAVGVAFGIDRLLLARRTRAEHPTHPAPLAPDLLVSTLHDAICLTLVEALRAAGLTVAYDLAHATGEALVANARSQGIASALEWLGAAGALYTLTENPGDTAVQTIPATVLLETLLNHPALRPVASGAAAGDRP
ncbi:MAG: ATP phosphoribosyltransferase regulatory subunit [Anaerolineales bacterium]|nr:ATP phosphoribosyltransferase regulatory subunit [Anaerolineales bacterium]